MLYEALARAYGIRAVSFNSQTGLFKFGRATCVVDQLAEPKDLQKHWGKNYSLILCDEVGEYSGLDLVEKLRASLRPPAGIPARMVLIGNPGGPNHAVLLRSFVAGHDAMGAAHRREVRAALHLLPEHVPRQPAHRPRRLRRAAARRLRERSRDAQGVVRWLVRRDEGWLLQQRRRRVPQHDRAVAEAPAAEVLGRGRVAHVHRNGLGQLGPRLRLPRRGVAGGGGVRQVHPARRRWCCSTSWRPTRPTR